MVRATPFLSISRLIDEDGCVVAEAEERLIELRICLSGDDLPALVDRELMLDPIETLSKVEELRRAPACTPPNVALRVRPGRELFFGERALRTDFMTRSSSAGRFCGRDFRLVRASNSFSRLDSCIWW